MIYPQKAISILFLCSMITAAGCMSGNEARVTVELGLPAQSPVTGDTGFIDTLLGFFSTRAYAAPAPPDIESIVLTVSGPGMSTITKSIPTGTGSVTLLVPPGNSRLFTVLATGAARSFSGSTVADLGSGDTTLTIQMRSLINNAYDGDITSDGSSIFISFTSADTGELWFGRSADQGATWTYTVVDSTADVWGTAIVTGGELIHIVYIDETDTGVILKSKSSSDGGATWPADPIIIYSTGSPDIYIDSLDLVYISGLRLVFESGGNIYYDSSGDGVDWSGTEQVGDETGGMTPAVTAYGAAALRAYVFYGGPMLGTGLYMSSNPDGFSPGILIDENGFMYIFGGVSVLPGGSGSYVVYTAIDSTGDRIEIRFADVSPDGTVTSQSSVDSVILDNSFYTAPAMATGSGNLYVVYTSFREISDTAYESSVKFARSTDNGATWSSQVLESGLNTFFGLFEKMGIAADGNNVYMLYEVWGETFVGLKLLRSDDAGATWQ